MLAWGHIVQLTMTIPVTEHPGMLIPIRFGMTLLSYNKYNTFFEIAIGPFLAAN